jgi:DeoR/GlpR family transcriptional regulator of sugar metabolism
MIASASKVVVLLHSGKVGIKSLMTVMSLDEIEVLITDEECPAELVQALRVRGIDVHIAHDLA